jgi:hypothetical protein
LRAVKARAITWRRLLVALVARHWNALAAVCLLAVFGGDSNASGEDDPLRLEDIVGRYWMSDGRARFWTVAVRSDGTFTASDFIRDRQGVAKVSSGSLALVVPPGDEWQILVPVRLGGRLYLVPLHRQLDFCIALAEGREPRRSDVGDFLVRVGDERIPVAEGTMPPFCQEPGRRQ